MKQMVFHSKVHNYWVSKRTAFSICLHFLPTPLTQYNTPLDN